MGKIRSALEIALERTETVKGDKGSIGQFEAKQKGKKLANEFIEGSVKSLEDEIKKIPKEEKANFMQGIFDILISRITLPSAEDDLKQIEAASRGIKILLDENRNGSRFAEIGQLMRYMKQFLEESAELEEALKRQYAPKLRQKEEEIYRRLGRQVKLEPFQDPEFAALFNQHMNALKANFQTALDGARETAVMLFENP